MVEKYKFPNKPMYIEKRPDGHYALVYVFKEGDTKKEIRKKLGRRFREGWVEEKVKEIEERLENYNKITKEEIQELLKSVNK